MAVPFRREESLKVTDNLGRLDDHRSHDVRRRPQVPSRVFPVHLVPVLHRRWRLVRSRRALQTLLVRADVLPFGVLSALIVSLSLQWPVLQEANAAALPKESGIGAEAALDPAGRTGARVGRQAPHQVGRGRRQEMSHVRRLSRYPNLRVSPTARMKRAKTSNVPSTVSLCRIDASADLMSLHIGDRILEVNGLPVVDQPLEQIENMLRSPEATLQVSCPVQSFFSLFNSVRSG